MKYNWLKITMLAVIYLFSTLWLIAQNITIRQTISNVPGVCDQSAITITVRNDESQDWHMNRLTVRLPCGFEYVTSSVSGASEFIILQKSAPVFDLETIAQKTEKVFTINIVSNCSTLTCLNEGGLFRNEFLLGSLQGQKIVQSDNYNVETPNIVVTNIQDPFMEVEVGGQITRKLTIKNTRSGRIDKFIFQDMHDPLLEITADKGKIIHSGQGKTILEIGPEVFQQIGNQDGFFDFNEEIILTEIIKVKGCILQPKFVQSEITAGWGCFNEVCKTTLVRATIKVLPRQDPGDKFSLSAEVLEPDCYFQSAVRQKLSVLVKPTASDLENIEILIDQTELTRAIVSGSVVVPNGFTVTYLDENISSCSLQVAKKILIKGAKIQASDVGQKFDFFFDLAFCERTGCVKEKVVWKASYEYKKACTTIEDAVQKGTFIARQANTVSHEIELLIEGHADDGKAGVIRYKYQNNKLLMNQGKIRVRLKIPDFLKIIPTNFAIGNIVPSVNQWVINGIRFIDLEYPLPLPSSFTLLIPVIVNCADFTTSFTCVNYITSCPENCGGPVKFNIEAMTTFLLTENCPFGANPEDCTFYEFFSDCQPDCTIDQVVGGYALYDFTITRNTIGLPDKDSDQIPDPDGIYDMSLIRHDQMYYGDTFNIDIYGKIITDFQDSVFRNAIIKLALIQDVNGSSDFLNTAMEVQHATLTLWDKSENRHYIFEQIPYTYQNFTYAFNLSRDSLVVLNPALPQGFVFQDGDTLHLNVQKVFIKNFNTPSVGWNNHIMFFTYAPVISVTNQEINPARIYYACGCPTRQVQLIGFNYWSQWAIPGVAQCPGNSLAQGVLFNYGYPVNSPGEIKFYIRPVGIKIGKVDNIRLDSLGVSTGIVPQRVFKNYIDNGDHLYVDISEFTGVRNFRGGLRFWLYRSAETCIGTTIPATSCEIVYEKSPFMDENFEDKFTYTLQNFLSVPSVLLEIQQKEYTAILPDITIPLKLINEINNQVRNVFIRPVYDPSGFQNVKIELSGLPVNYPDINGYYIMGNMFQKEIRDIRFRARARNCGRQKIVFEYGYDCGVYSNPAEKPCFLKRDSLFIDFQDGELEIFASQDETLISLCDSIAESSYTVHNSGLGNVFHVKPTITLPKGMDIIPGSCRIIFPSGSGQSFSIPNPDNVSDRTYRWDLASFWQYHLQNGLSSVSESPQNAFDIIYKTTTNCDFISGTSERYGVSGLQVCGTSANLLTKSGPLYKIPGNQNNVNIQLSATTPDSIQCDEIKTILIQYNNEHTGSSSLLVQMPDGIKTLAGSFSGNIPVINPVESNGFLEWNIPPGVTPVVVSFQIQASSDSGCQPGQFEISTTSGRDAFCVATQTFCEIQEISGKITRPVIISKPKAEILSFDMINHPDSINYFVRAVIRLQNASGILRGRVVYDANNDNMITSSDPVLGYIQFNPATGSQGVITAGTALDPSLLPVTCRLWLVLDDEDNCLCSRDVMPVRNNIIFTTDTLRLCWNETAVLGPERQPEKTYQWNNSEGLSCSQCANPVFHVPNAEIFTSQSYSRLMTETDIFSGCIHQYSYFIEVQPRPRILSTLDTICASDTVRIFTTEFSDSYTWSGATFIENEGSFVRAVVEKSGWIRVYMADSDGCPEWDSIFVPVRDIPLSSFINEGIFCYGQEFLIGYNPEQGITYQWIDPNGILETPDSNITKVNTLTDQIVYLQIQNGVCSRVDSFPIQLYEGVDVTGTQDTFYSCIGDTLQIDLSGADSYHWGPDFTGTCLNDSCSSVRFVPPTNTLYSFTVLASTDEGCKKEYEVHIVGIDDSRLVTERHSLCQGDSLLFYGQTIKREGIYCDTTSVGNCSYIQCAEVSFTPPGQSMVSDSICQGDVFTFMGQSYTQPGTYTLQLQSASGCDSIITLQLYVVPLPVFEILSEQELTKGENITITLPANYTYLWSPGTGLSCSTCPETMITGDENILYTITAFNELGCPVTKMLRINIKDQCVLEDIKLPNAFTPNGDNINDTYMIPGLGICEVKITVFNRWGNIVYTQFPYENDWNGISENGGELPQGTYYILLESANGQIKKTGMIDLRRQ